jgi:VWFA-related protein
MRFRLCFTLAVVVLSGALLAQQQAVFRSETNYVEVDAVVTDAAGHFVPGLHASDFEVRERRQPQKVATFSVIDLPVGPGAPASGHMPPFAVRPTAGGQSAIAGDRIYLIYMDAPGAMDTLMARHHARDFVQTFMGPDDLVAIWDSGYGASGLTFTNDRAALLRTIDEPGTAPTGVSQADRLRAAIDWLSDIQGRRKSLLLFTGGYPGYAGGYARQAAVTEWLWNRALPSTIGDSLSPTDIRERADVHIYTYDVRGLVAPGLEATQPHPYSGTPQAIAAQQTAALSGLSSNSFDLRAIADATGGLAFVDSNDFAKGLTRIVEDNSHYYILGYYSPDLKRDGVIRQISVRVSQPGLTVRARNGYIAR